MVQQLPIPPSRSSGRLNEDQQTLRTFFLVSAIVNGVAAVGWLFGTIFGGILSCGFGCIAIVIPLILGVAIYFDVDAIRRIDRGLNPYDHSTLLGAAILDIVAGVCGSIVPVVLGIFELIWIGREGVSMDLWPESERAQRNEPVPPAPPDTPSGE